MINFSYTISPFLKKELDSLDGVRTTILLSLLSPRDETRLRWEVTLQRIIAALKITGQPVSEQQINVLLSPLGKKTLTAQDKAIIAYKDALDHIRHDWTMNTDLVETQTLVKLHQFIGTSPLRLDHKELKTMITFLQVSPEHPVIQAGIAFIIYYQMLGKNNEAKLHALLLANIFMYKNGYELRGMLNLEEYLLDHSKSLFDLLDASLNSKNISAFLDYFTLAVVTQAEKSAKKLTQKQFETSYPESFFTLSERQKAILSLLDKPGGRITNKSVQERFHVSQITASRELAKLATLGLLLSLGKGRSVYYTKT
jgi:hypothetical protein